MYSLKTVHKMFFSTISDIRLSLRSDYHIAISIFSLFKLGYTRLKTCANLRHSSFLFPRATFYIPHLNSLLWRYTHIIIFYLSIRAYKPCITTCCIYRRIKVAHRTIDHAYGKLVLRICSVLTLEKLADLQCLQWIIIIIIIIHLYINTEVSKNNVKVFEREMPIRD